MRTHSHQITIEYNRERSERDQIPISAQLAKPPTNNHHVKNQLSVGPPVGGRRDPSLGMRRGSSKNAGEIVIED